MLALTDSAQQAVAAIVSQPETPDGAMLRLSTAESHTNGAVPARELQLAVVEAPAEGDAVLEGVGISLEPGAVDFLDDKILDAEFIGGNVQFSLRRQGGDGSDPGDGPGAEGG